jgi:COP9 signalosome complex subunit 1
LESQFQLNPFCWALCEQDLETYASSYRGLAKLLRLVFVAEHCPPLRVEALRMALAHVMTTYNTSSYQEIHKSLQEAITRLVYSLSNMLVDSVFLPVCRQSILPDTLAGIVHNAPSLDTQWVESSSKKAALKLEKLDTDLKNYKSNSIKESIRYGM